MPPLTTPADPAGLLGRTLDGRYQALAFVGEGDLGFVYRGEQIALHRACALKVLRPEVQRDPARLQRIMKGSQRVARRRFDALVPADDVLTTADRTTLILPWLLGEDLTTLLRVAPGRLPWGRVRELLLQIGAALSELHAAGFVCAGLKPSNVFLVHGSDGGTIVKLLDVGLSRHDAATATITYMAPEWVAGGEPDSRADVYNLAVLAYTALTGEPAFLGPPVQIALLKRVKTPRPPRTVAPDAEIPAQVEALLMRSLERDPNTRPSMASFLAMVTEARGEGSPSLADEEGVTRYFRRVPASPPQSSQSGEIHDHALPATGQFKRSSSSTSVPPIEATRVMPVMADRTQVRAPPLPTKQPTSSPPSIAIVEATRIAVPRPSHPLVEPVRAPARTTLTEPPSRPVETTQFLPSMDPATLKLPANELTSVLKRPGQPRNAPDAHTDQTSRTLVIPGFGGSVLVEPDAVAHGAMATTTPGPPPRRWALWDRVIRRFRRSTPTERPRKPGLWARIRGVRATHLPARRGPTRLDKFLRRLAEIPSYIGRAWRFTLKPFGRITGLRSKLTSPLMALRTTFGRLVRLFSRWTGGGT